MAPDLPAAVLEILERERALQREIMGRVFAPADTVFDLLEESGAALREQAAALEEAGRALGHAAALMKAQAELFERTIHTIRQPTELAKTVTGAPKKQPARRRRAG